MGRDGWKTRSGAAVRVETDHRGEFIVCDGCRRRIRVTGAGPVMFAVREHAKTCRD